MPTSDFIHRVDRELGTATDSARAPREFLTLPGTLPEACQLPSFEDIHAYHDRYGFQTYDEPQNLEILARIMNDGAGVIAEFKKLANERVGQDVLDAAEFTLRNLTRIEQMLAPLFTGLTMSQFGVARSTCIAARALVGIILDEKALAGEL